MCVAVERERELSDYTGLLCVSSRQLRIIISIFCVAGNFVDVTTVQSDQKPWKWPRKWLRLVQLHKRLCDGAEVQSGQQSDSCYLKPSELLPEHICVLWRMLSLNWWWCQWNMRRVGSSAEEWGGGTESVISLVSGQFGFDFTSLPVFGPGFGFCVACSDSVNQNSACVAYTGSRNVNVGFSLTLSASS